MAAERRGEKLASTVLWRIENTNLWYSDINTHKFNSEICSPAFLLNNLDESEWVLSFQPTGEYFKFRSEMNFCLFPTRHVQTQLIDCEWSILGCDGSPIHSSFVSEETNDSFSHYMVNCPSCKDMFQIRRSLFVPNDTLMVRLRVWKTDEEFELAEQVSLVTRILDESLEESFIWRIQKFTTLQLDKKVETTVYMGGLAFRLMFFLTGESLTESNINFGIVYESACEEDLGMKISLLDRDGKETKCLEKEHKFSSIVCEQSLVVPKLISRREILKFILWGGDLTFLCEFSSNFKYFMRTYIEKSYCGPENLDGIFGSNRNSLKKTTPKCPRTIVSTNLDGIVENTHLSSEYHLGNALQRNTLTTVLSNEFLSLFNQQTLSDFELRAVDGTFPVHKNILSARSPVFQAMFCGDMKEAYSESLNVPDLDANTLGKFLTFLYAGIIDDMNWESAAKLYYAADKYQILSLKQECASILQKKITLSNVSDLLELADRHQDPDLKAFLLDFIQNNFDAVILSEEWDNFMERSYLAAKTMKEIYIIRRNYKRTLGDIWHRDLINKDLY